MKNRTLLVSHIGVLLLSPLNSASALDRPWLEVESHSLGDGWFRYHVRSLWAPFIASINITAVDLRDANWIEAGPPPARWTLTQAQGQTSWAVDDAYPHWQVRPYEAVFEARSSWTNYTMGSVTVLMSLCRYDLLGYSPYVGVNIVGYCNIPALVPCAEPPTNSVPASFNTNLTYNADIQIRQLLREGQETRGIEFVYNDAATLLLEATPDLEDWRKVAYLYAVSGTNRWTTNTDLGRWGNFYRLEYVGYGHLSLSDLPPLDLPANSVPGAAKSAGGPVAVPLSAISEAGNLKVRLQTLPGTRYEVQVLSAGKMVWSSRLTASGKETLVSLPTTKLPAFGIISAHQLR